MADDKDRLGEKLHQKEKAEEDRYFAERDRELIAKLKQAQAAEQEAMIRELARSRCPQCGPRSEGTQPPPALRATSPV